MIFTSYMHEDYTQFTSCSISDFTLIPLYAVCLSYTYLHTKSATLQDTGKSESDGNH